MADRRQSIPAPVVRAVRVLAADPGLTARFETALINETMIAVPWEEPVPGPVGEYIAVVDTDEIGRRLHPPVDLAAPAVLAQQGLPVSDEDPQFHQQMVDAVAMRTIRKL